MRTTCKNPECPRKGKPFKPQRAGAQYCSVGCRVAGHRTRHKRVRPTFWFGKVPGMRDEKEALAKQLVELANGEDDGKPKTGRRYYYLALSYGYIRPDMGASAAAQASRDAAYDRVTEVLGILRKRWPQLPADDGKPPPLPCLPWSMVLDLTRDLDQWQTYADPRDARRHLREQYDEDRWLGQPHYPIMIVEKDAMEPSNKPIASRWQMPFASSRGYSSLRLQYDVAKLFIERRGKYGQTGIVYFVSDLDPSGEDLQRAWEDALRDFGASARVIRIGLTIEQVRDNVGPRGEPLADLAIEVKGTDSRAKGYCLRYIDEPLVNVQVTKGRNKKGEEIDVYTGRCWETDILPASVIEQAIDADIRQWLDADLWRRREAEIERARALL